MRRLPLILAVLALIGGLGLIGSALLQPDKPDPAFTTASAADADKGENGIMVESPPASPSAPPSPSRKTTTAYRFPVLGNASYARTHHDYPASDIMAACGATTVSPVDGVVLEVTLVDTWTARVNAGDTRGGLSWSILGDDGVRYYGSHLASVDSKIRAGVRVTAGQKLGKVGETGDASACHLHFGISPACKKTGDWWIRRGVIFPWSYLDAWRKGQQKSPLSAINAWHAEHGCPSKALVDP